ncbi:MAG: preprotein translocase subunit YajC [Zavarzinella sp.]
MIYHLLFSLFLFADAAAPPAEGAPKAGPPGLLSNPLLPLLFVGIMMIFFFRSGSKQRKQLQETLNNMKRGDHVVTRGGIIGTVVSIKENEDEVTIKTDESSNSRVRVLKSSIIQVKTGDTVVGDTKA